MSLRFGLALLLFHLPDTPIRVFLLEISIPVFGSLSTKIDKNLISDIVKTEEQGTFVPKSHLGFSTLLSMKVFLCFSSIWLKF